MSADKRKRDDQRKRSPEIAAVEKNRRKRDQEDEEDESKRQKVRIKEEPREKGDDRRRRRNSPPIRNEAIVKDQYRHQERRRDNDDNDYDRDRDQRRRKSPPPDRGGKFRGDDDGGKKYEWGKRPVKTEEKTDEAGAEDEKPKEKPNFGLTGNLAKDTNAFNGVVIKYNEPPEARKPKLRWRLYPFKGDESLDFIPVHRQSAYLLGRDRRIADIPIDHPSCSKQHAVLQYRLVKRNREDGSISRRVRPYVIDLGSANGTFVNNKQVEAQRYYELFEKDMIKFGFSSREYVLLHENSQEEVAAAEEVGEEAEMTTVEEGT